MMKKILFLLVLVAVCGQQVARADEGMWLPFLIGRNYEDMKKHGLKLTQDQLYSINNASLKDAVISFGGFCTGELISDKSLILTNHHCGYDAIAGASTPEKNYLDNGFWAKNFEQEIPVAGLTATFMIRMEDVSQTVLKELTASMTNEQRAAKIKEITDVLVKDATKGTEYEGFVSEFYNGNEFYLFIKQTYKDVRLVGTAPQSAGKYGGDVDNWEWPRHTADFSMFRIYAGSDNKPADFAKTNVPLKPKKFLPISLKGVQKNDFAMVMGFPGRTNRYLTSYGVEQAVNIEQPKIVDIRAKKLEIMKKYMDKDVQVRLYYSSKYAQVANYWKYYIGQSKQLTNNKVADKKRSIESDFTKYSAGKEEYKNVLSEIENAFKTTNNIVYIRTYQSEFVRQVDINLFAYYMKLYADASAKNQTDRANQLMDAAKAQAEVVFTERSMDIELETLKEVLKMYLKDIPYAQRVGITRSLTEKSLDAFIARVKKNSIFTDKKRFDQFVASKSMKDLMKDPLFILMKDLDNGFVAATSEASVKTAVDNLTRANRLFIKAVRAMNPTRNYAPNANSTMRLTYGNVLPYTTNEGKFMDFTTDFDGLLKKEKPGDPEFTVEQRMKDVYAKKDLGQYADKSGKLVVNFLTNNDITGGNSGSPCINGNGELIGAAFDGNWEAMSGDIYFEPNLQRTIVCDIRYILWLVDKCYGATNLINEMKLVR